MAAGGKAPAIHGTRTNFAAKLSSAADESNKYMQPFRRTRKELVEAYVGPYYRGKSPKEVSGSETIPLNLLYSFVTAVTPRLALNPRADVTTPNPDLLWFANLLREAINRACDEVRLKQAFRKALVDSLFCMGILKVGLGVDGAGGLDEVDGWLHDPAKPFVDAVDLDDYIPDHTARRRDQMLYEGDQERILYDWGMESGLYDKGELERLAKSEESASRTSDISAQSKPGQEPLYRMVTLRHFWLPHTGDIVTIGAHGTSRKFLREISWEGPERGPYERIELNAVPGNAMAIAPTPQIYDLHLLANTMARKLGRQAERTKELTVVWPGDDALANTVKGANDGDVIFGNTQHVTRLLSGGVAQPVYEAVAWFGAMFNQIAGNPNQIGGLESQGETLGQEQMLLASALGKISDWRATALDVGNEVLRKIAWYVWTDPMKSMDLNVPIGGGLSVPARWTAEAREGDFLDYNFTVQPYSAEHSTPEAQFAKAKGLLVDVVLPLSQQAAAQGMVLDVPEMVDRLFRWANIPGFESMFRREMPQVLPGIQPLGSMARPPDAGQPGQSPRPVQKPAVPETAPGQPAQ